MVAGNRGEGVNERRFRWRESKKPKNDEKRRRKRRPVLLLQGKVQGEAHKGKRGIPVDLRAQTLVLGGGITGHGKVISTEAGEKIRKELAGRKNDQKRGAQVLMRSIQEWIGRKAPQEGGILQDLQKQRGVRRDNRKR